MSKSELSKLFVECGIESDESHICRAPHRIAGFTVIEIIIVLLIIGVIAAVTTSRFADGNSFNGVVLRDQLINATRLAQQSAQGRADVELRLTPDGAGRAAIAVSEANGNIQTSTISLASVELTGEVNGTTSCDSTAGTSITNSAPLVLEFGELGDVISAGVGVGLSTVNSAIRVCIDEQAATSVCISSAGFAYIGDCDVD